MQVAVCIATHKRPKLLHKLLVGLQNQTFSQIDRPEVHIVVVDNDVAGSAAEVCQQAATSARLTYVVETRRGIANARNRTLQEAGKPDVVAFIDDDEQPESTWLEQLLLARKKYSADVVFGPVQPRFAEEVPKWIKREGFFDPPQYQTGEELDWAATNNALVGRSVLERVPQFDDRFQLSGGEDFHYFKTVYLLGFRILWCQEAIVHEVIAKDRGNMRALIRRLYRAGNSASLVERAIDPRLTTRLLRIVKAVGSIFAGLGLSFLVPFRHPLRIEKPMRRLCLGLGQLAASAGFVHNHYTTTSGE